MLGEDPDAFICDMAETYHILDIWALPVELLATLASGLRENSRIKMKLSGMNYVPVEIVVPHIADQLTMVFKTEDADPLMFTDIMLGNTKDNEKVEGFSSGSRFEQKWSQLTRG